MSNEVGECVCEENEDGHDDHKEDTVAVRYIMPARLHRPHHRHI